MMLLIVVLTAAAGAGPAPAQPVTTLIVDIRTGDVRFGGTDDSVHLLIGGREFPLDDPDRDDFERDNTDRFTLDLSTDPLSIELIRGVGQLSIVKMEDSFFGGGWRFGGLTIWAGNPGTDPIFSNDSVDRWLDGDDLEWVTTLDDPGWNVPEPPAFPPCTGTIIIFLKAAGYLSLDSDCDGISDDQDPTFDTARR